MTNRANPNRDNIKRLNYPRQSYAISGTDYGDAPEGAQKIRGKAAVDSSPMAISSMPPGVLAKNDEWWSQVYGASLDSYLSLLDGSVMLDSITNSFVAFSSPYREGLPLATNSNLYEQIGSSQQIQYMVGKSTVQEARSPSGPLNPGEVRSIGIRAPAQMCGWGKTIAMRPTDPEPEDIRVNDDEHKLDRSTWKVGPLDVRWDEQRSMWRAFNDLIADDESQNMGTFVFGTNSDKTCGFPFLRGRLEDVWSVRKTYREQPALGRDDDIEQTAHVCTKLEGLAIQNDLVAKWSQVFEITKQCTNSQRVGTCGTETTSEAGLTILTDAKFYNGFRAGPIGFAGDPPDDILLGTMFFIGEGNCGQWVPGVPEPDICELAGVQFGITFDNDKALQVAIETLCKDGVKYNRTHRKELAILTKREVAEDINDVSATIDGLIKVEAWTVTIIASINAAIRSAVAQGINALATSTQAAISSVVAQLVGLMNSGFSQFATKLDEICGCTAPPPFLEAPSIVLNPVTITSPFVNPPLDLFDELERLNDTGVRMNAINNDFGTYIGTFDLPKIFPLGTIKDPCDPTTVVTKNCTI